MKFSQLRLSGFKSFVEPTELQIEDGLTGIVGPNGCGKSNLLEALRWVMGESSIKRMRASGMDDVIFAGTATRPARNMAEVMICMEGNGGAVAPELSGEHTLQISRRIEREAGSAYRINAKDVRARDVQLLFADASTGARSPALVQQGRIGELINAKPQARRRILEEAAGITGLFSRRHEAELKLKAAETNLDRLNDVIAQLENQLHALKRQARQAVRYKTISADIRRLDAASLYLNWRESCARRDEDRAGLEQRTQALGELVRHASETARSRQEIDESLVPLREAANARAAAVQRLVLERESLEREEARASARHSELEAALKQISADLVREGELVNDCHRVLENLNAEKDELICALEAGAGGQNDAAEMLRLAGEALAGAQQRADKAGAAFSTLKAQRESAESSVADLTRRLGRLGHEMREVAEKRRTLGEKTGSAGAPDELEGRLNEARAAIRNAEHAYNTAKGDVECARAGESAARQACDKARSTAETLGAEVRTLTKVLDVAASDLWPPLIDAIDVDAGLETALGAALGDDVGAPADEVAPIHWRELDPLTGQAALPEGVEPLSRHVRGPAVLNRRLTHTGLVARDSGARLQAVLQPGQRLVSREGDLWRWDGYAAAADAPTAAAKRLAERNRLGALRRECEEAQTTAETTNAALREALHTVASAAAAEEAAREAWREATAAGDACQAALDTLRRQQDEHVRQQSALEEAERRLAKDHADATARMQQARESLAALAPVERAADERDKAHVELERQRAHYNEARAHRDGMEREAHARNGRLKAVTAECQQWTTRAERAAHQIEALKQRRDGTAGELEKLADVPAHFETRRAALLETLSGTQTSASEANDALASAQNRLSEAATLARQAEAKLGDAREDRARLETRLEASVLRLEEIEAGIADTLDCAPAEIASTMEINVEKLPPLDQIGPKLAQLRAQRERLGGVNLRAELESEEVDTQMTTLVQERDDVVQAVNKLRHGIGSLNREGRQRLISAFDSVNTHFSSLFTTLFGGGKAELQLIESDDPLQAGLEIMAQPPGKRAQVLSLLSGGEQALTSMALIFAVFATNPSPICVLDEVDAPLDDHNVERFCNLLDAMLERTSTRFLIITHHAVTMSRMHRLFGVTMMERGVSQLVSVDLQTAERMREAS